MEEVSTIGLDLAKHVFQLHGADAAGRAVFRKQLRRGEVLRFLGSLEPCVVAMEACGSAHYWGREIARLGHEVRLIAPAYSLPPRRRGSSRSSSAARTMPPSLS
jgi:transposase